MFWAAGEVNEGSFVSLACLGILQLSKKCEKTRRPFLNAEVNDSNLFHGTFFLFNDDSMRITETGIFGDESETSDPSLALLG